MAYELIIAEKPKASQKIAQALADGKPIKKSENGVPYYEITHGKTDVVVACAVGHLYTVGEKKKKKGWTFPVFEVEWKESASARKDAAYSRKYLNVIKKLAKKAKSFTVACDYDIEGEVIGLNCVRYACNKKDAARMKFSTLTKPDIIESYEHKSKHLDWGQANAGEARHIMDWFNGINYSRALTAAIKSTGAFKIMSMGRVQGPALKLIVDKEREIKAFKPVPFWQIELLGEVDKKSILAWHEKDKFWDKKEASKVFNKVKGEKKALVQDVSTKEFQQFAPHPFDLTSLQIESHRCFGIAPKITLEIAQELYTSGYISYPRTSSQVLPVEIKYTKIIKRMQKQKNYTKLGELLLKKKDLIPNNGKKTDPAHPAIYPTGIAPKALKQYEKKIYDLIVKRFFATFGEPAIRETMKIDINCKEEIFIAKGTRTVKKGWHILYEPYVNLKEEELPKVEKDQQIKVKKIILHDKETLPPKRYTDASIIKELEKRNLGTKATRASIIDTLFNRNYVEGKPIEATELGIATIGTFEKYCPKLLDEGLTKHFEEAMEGIREGKVKQKAVLKEVKEAISKILVDLKKHEKKIGKDLAEANRKAQDKQNYIGKCPNCGGKLQMRRGKFGRFIACAKYPKCKTTFNLPNTGFVKPREELCKECKFPTVLMIRKGKKPQIVCINPKCPTKKVRDKAAKKEIKQLESGKIEKPCPKCRHTEKLDSTESNGSKSS